MGIAALGCRGVVVILFSNSNVRKLYDVSVSVATTFGKLRLPKTLFHIENKRQSQRQLYAHITSKMSVERQKDKSKVHKLSLKGTASALKLRASLTRSRIIEARCGIREFSHVKQFGYR
jgi:hypothetical protein